MKPAWRPISFTKPIPPGALRASVCAQSRTRAASSTALKNPKVRDTNATSLSIVFGIPTTESAWPRRRRVARAELALFATKVDVDEEITRLQTHFAEVERVLAEGGARSSPVGERLDFLAQELNREANTLASKAASAEISECALELKVLVEQIREQVQNLE